MEKETLKDGRNLGGKDDQEATEIPTYLLWRHQP